MIWLVFLALGTGFVWYYLKIYVPRKKQLEKRLATGVTGEKQAVEYLHKMFAEHGVTDYYILQNVILEYAPGRTTEIDIVCLTRKGIYVVEMKNYKGKITGDEGDYQWIQEVGYKEKRFFPFYNPVKQNLTHIRTLQRYVKPPIYNWVLFGHNAELNVTYTQTIDLQIHTLNEDFYWYRNYTQLPYVLTHKQLKDLKDKININIRSKSTFRAHVRRLQFQNKKIS